MAALTVSCMVMLVIAPWWQALSAARHARFLDHVHICVHPVRLRIVASLALPAHSAFSDLQTCVTVRPRLVGRGTAPAGRSGVPATKRW